jgi:lysozyme
MKKTTKAVPFVLAGGMALAGLVRWEGNVTHVYADRLAGGLPTYCAGATGWDQQVGKQLSEEYCAKVNRGTLLKYGTAIAACTEWQHLNQFRFDALTLFAVNVGVNAACGSRAVRLINAGQIKEGCDALARTPDGNPSWSFASGKYVQGLQNRRLFERDWCLRGLA